MFVSPCEPDLSARPYRATAARLMPVDAERLYAAFTMELERWFAAPGSLLMKLEVNAPFFFEMEHRFETEASAVRQPHYGRFLELVPERSIRMTWVSGPEGTCGVETVLTISLHALGESTTRVELKHEGFAAQAAAEQHEKAWPFVLAQLEAHLTSTPALRAK